MQSFETTVLPVVEKFARKMLRDEETRQTAVVMAWWFWSNRKEDFPPSVWAKCGVRAARAGRDLPGLAGKFRDIWDRMPHWSGAGMDEVADRRPGPDRIAADREEWQLWLSRLSPSELLLAWDAIDGVQGKDIAKRLGLTPARISQMRRAMFSRWE